MHLQLECRRFVVQNCEECPKCPNGIKSQVFSRTIPTSYVEGQAFAAEVINDEQDAEAPANSKSYPKIQISRLRMLRRRKQKHPNQLWRRKIDSIRLGRLRRTGLSMSLEDATSVRM